TDGLRRVPLRLQFFDDTGLVDLVELVERDEHGVEPALRESTVACDRGQVPPVVDPNGEIGQAQREERLGCGKDQLELGDRRPHRASRAGCSRRPAFRCAGSRDAGRRREWWPGRGLAPRPRPGARRAYRAAAWCRAWDLAPRRAGGHSRTGARRLAEPAVDGRVTCFSPGADSWIR